MNITDMKVPTRISIMMKNETVNSMNNIVCPSFQFCCSMISPIPPAAQVWSVVIQSQ